MRVRIRFKDGNEITIPVSSPDDIDLDGLERHQRQSASFLDQPHQIQLLADSLTDSIVIRKQGRNNTAKRTIGSPLNANFLFYLFLDAENCDALVGDLQERHTLIHKKFGQRRADFWYWTQAIRSVGPIVWAATKKMMKSATGLAALVELYRRIRS